MQPIKINCPHCGHPMEYWTRSDTIVCPGCKEAIPVEPCKESLNTEVPKMIEGEEDAVTI